MRTRKRIGDMLIDEGLLTKEQVRQALRQQKGSGLKLGAVLVRNGIVNEDQIVACLSRQLMIERYVPDKYPIEVGLASMLDAELAQKHQVVPLLHRPPRLLVVAITDPTDIVAIDTVESETNMEVEPVICTEMELNQLTSAVYGVSAGFGDILKSVEAMEVGHEENEDVTADDLQLGSLRDQAEGAPVVRMVNWIIAQGVRERASDIHVSPERTHVQLRFRVDGKLREVPAPPKNMLLPIISRIKILAHMDIAVTRLPQDGRFTARVDDKEINIRASVVPTTNGENMVLRLLDTSSRIHTLDRLGMDPDSQARMKRAVTRPHGMILSTGPTGSGKTTSLYAILQTINTQDVNIITLEDPVEYRVRKIRQLQLNRKAGMTFASGLRSVLRQDPDVIMVGEIRDAETASIAVQAALTGHRVLSTVHTNDAAGAITRLIDMGVPPFLVSSVLLVSFAQRLVRRVCRHCRRPYEPSVQEREFLGIGPDQEGEFVKGVGCHQCLQTGYVGRSGIYEILIVDDQVREMILSRHSAQEITRAAVEAGHLRTLKQDVAEKVCQGITSFEEAATVIMG